MVLDRLSLNTREFEIPVETWWGTLKESGVEQEVGVKVWNRKGAVGLEFIRRLSVVGGD